MTTYLTWIATDGPALPASVADLRGVTARRPSEGAAIAALKVPTPKFPWNVSIGVMRADRLGCYDARARRYWVEFERTVKKVEVIR